MLRVSWVARLTSRGRTSERAGMRRTSSNVSAFWRTRMQTAFSCSQNRIIQTASHLGIKDQHDDQPAPPLQDVVCGARTGLFTLPGLARGRDIQLEGFRRAHPLFRRSTAGRHREVDPQCARSEHRDGAACCRAEEHRRTGARLPQAQAEQAEATRRPAERDRAGKEPLLRTAREADPGHRGGQRISRLNAEGCRGVSG